MKQRNTKTFFLWIVLSLSFSNLEARRIDIYKFKLTECIGQKLKTPATFYLDTKSVYWTLDFNSGDKVVYKILSGYEHDPLCGLKAVDSFGDNCTICIRPNGSAVTITFDYYGKKLVYKGSKI